MSNETIETIFLIIVIGGLGLALPFVVVELLQTGAF